MQPGHNFGTLVGLFDRKWAPWWRRGFVDLDCDIVWWEPHFNIDGVPNGSKTKRGHKGANKGQKTSIFDGELKSDRQIKKDLQKGGLGGPKRQLEDVCTSSMHS